MNSEPAITATECTKILPTRNGRRVNRRTVIRWMKNGCRGIRLRAWQEGGIWLTTESALEEFRQALTTKSLVACGVNPIQKCDATAARAALKRDGFYKPKPQQERWKARRAAERAQSNTTNE